MKEIVRKHGISFQNALRGVIWSFRTQPNFRIHIFLAVCAITLGVTLGISRLEMIIITFTIVLGITSEMINTAIESMTDLITKEWRAEAKIAKDVSAGMMLVAAVGAVVVASMLYIPYLLLLFPMN